MHIDLEQLWAFKSQSFEKLAKLTLTMIKNVGYRNNSTLWKIYFCCSLHTLYKLPGPETQSQGCLAR